MYRMRSLLPACTEKLALECPDIFRITKYFRDKDASIRNTDDFLARYAEPVSYTHLITIFGGYAVLAALGFNIPLTLTALFVCVVVFAIVRGFLRYAEQACNHFIAFKLLALLRDKVFRALRRLCPAKLEGRDKGDLISVITSDIELLEVFYAHTISPAVIAVLFTVILLSLIHI